MIKHFMIVKMQRQDGKIITNIHKDKEPVSKLLKVFVSMKRKRQQMK